MRTLFTRVRLCPCDEITGPTRMIDDAAVLVDGDAIAWVGLTRDALPAHDRAIACDGLVMTPGLIDCHTHLVYADPERVRVDEFERKLAGVAYTEIAQQGGGIRATMRASREATEDDLFAVAARDVRELQRTGVTTVEVKASYATDLDHTLKEFRVIDRLRKALSVNVQATYCPQTIAPEFDGISPYAARADAFVDFVCDTVMPALRAQGIAEAVDSFCEREGVGLSLAQVRRILTRGRSYGWGLKLHADQFTHLGGASLVAELGGWSADHLEHTTEDCVRAMARAGTVATMLPGAFHYTRETKLPPVEAFRAHGVSLALSTDSNPGSSPITSALLAMNLGCLRLGLTTAEALRGMTRHAARAMGLSHVGTIEPGKQADLALWAIRRPSELAYLGGRNPCVAVVHKGRAVFDDAALGL